MVRSSNSLFVFFSFEAAVVDYTDAINSLEDVMYHMKLHGDEHEETDVIIEERKRLAPLLWSRAAAHIMIGRYRSAVTDCALALEANKDFDQVMVVLVRLSWLVIVMSVQW